MFYNFYYKQDYNYRSLKAAEELGFSTTVTPYSEKIMETIRDTLKDFNELKDGRLDTGGVMGLHLK